MNDLRNRLLELLADLEAPVAEAERLDGWTVESKAAAARYFQGVESALRGLCALPPPGICRGLDHWGVEGGNLLERIATLSSQIHKQFGSGSSNYSLKPDGPEGPPA